MISKVFSALQFRQLEVYIIVHLCPKGWVSVLQTVSVRVAKKTPGDGPLIVFLDAFEHAENEPELWSKFMSH